MREGRPDLGCGLGSQELGRGHEPRRGAQAAVDGARPQGLRGQTLAICWCLGQRMEVDINHLKSLGGNSVFRLVLENQKFGSTGPFLQSSTPSGAAQGLLPLDGAPTSRSDGVIQPRHHSYSPTYTAQVSFRFCEFVTFGLGILCSRSGSLFRVVRRLWR